MKTIVSNRRLFLRGVGGATLAIPFLPSLVAPRRSWGETVIGPNNRAFVAVCSQHGNVTTDNMYPMKSATEKRDIFPGHTITHGALSPTISGSETVLSPVLRGPSNQFTPGLIKKMLIQRAVDIPFFISHHTGGHLGNVAANDGVGGGEAIAAQGNPNPTIDQAMAWSPSFYPNANTIRERHVVFGNGGHTAGTTVSYGWSNPAARSGQIQGFNGTTSTRSIFTKIFGDGSLATAAPPQQPSTPTRKPVVDSVLESYRSLRQGNTRLSSGDKQTLDDYVGRIEELQRKLSVKPVALPPSCKGLKAPEEATNQEPVKRHALYNDLIAASIMCGGTRVFVISVSDLFIPYQGDWHQAVAHTGDQSKLVPSNSKLFQATLLDLASKLDVDAGDGGTFLDRSLLQWTQESGDNTHQPNREPVVTFGSAGGFFNTGMFVDWSNLNPLANTRRHALEKQAGILMNHWHANVMLAMGVPLKEWEHPKNKGYGYLNWGNMSNNPGTKFTGQSFRTAYRPEAIAAGSDPLPLITKAV
jgi:Protein of unknown function (DUF1552)